MSDFCGLQIHEVLRVDFLPYGSISITMTANKISFEHCPADRHWEFLFLLLEPTILQNSMVKHSSSVS